MALSFGLGVWRIKGLKMVIGPNWADDILSLQCVSVRGTPVGVIAPVEAEILVIGLSHRVGSSMGRSGWLLLMSQWACHRISAHGAAIICPCVVGIEYKSCALTGSSSLDTALVTGSLLFSAPVCPLPFVVQLDFLRGCYSVVVTVSGLLCSESFAGELVWIV